MASETTAKRPQPEYVLVCVIPACHAHMIGLERIMTQVIRLVNPQSYF